MAATESGKGFMPEDLPLLEGLSPRLQQELVANSVQHSVASGTVIFEQGELPTFQIIVMSGSAHLLGSSSAARQVLIEVVQPPELIIPAAVVTGAPYLMGARVPEASRLLMIHAATFRSAVAEDTVLARAVIDSLARQFRRMVRQVKSLKLRTAPERVGCYLLALARSQGNPERAVLPYEKNLIASELGMTRESFSRALSALEKSGVRVKGQTIFIDDALSLASKCSPDPLIDGED